MWTTRRTTWGRKWGQLETLDGCPPMWPADPRREPQQNPPTNPREIKPLARVLHFSTAQTEKTRIKRIFALLSLPHAPARTRAGASHTRNIRNGFRDRSEPLSRSLVPGPDGGRQARHDARLGQRAASRQRRRQRGVLCNRHDDVSDRDGVCRGQDPRKPHRGREAPSRRRSNAVVRERPREGARQPLGTAQRGPLRVQADGHARERLPRAAGRLGWEDQARLRRHPGTRTERPDRQDPLLGLHRRSAGQPQRRVVRVRR